MAVLDENSVRGIQIQALPIHRDQHHRGRTVFMLGPVNADTRGAWLSEELLEGASVEGGGAMGPELGLGLESLDESCGLLASDAVIAGGVEG
jgi:hypothetical protein